MKTILAYGDSLTWGFNPETGLRHAYEDRWSTILEAGLGGQARVIPEGLNGRTTVFDDHGAFPDRNGARILPTVIGTHTPLDAIILMLGYNELRKYIGNAAGAAYGMKRLIEIVQTYPYHAPYVAPAIVVVSPPRIVQTKHPDFSVLFEGAQAESEKLAGHCRRIAAEAMVSYFDASTVAKMAPIDGVHLDARNSRALGAALVPILSQLLNIELN
jgi:lysophospholipase L1-like esterase